MVRALVDRATMDDAKDNYAVSRCSVIVPLPPMKRTTIYVVCVLWCALTLLATPTTAVGATSNGLCSGLVESKSGGYSINLANIADIFPSDGSPRVLTSSNGGVLTFQLCQPTTLCTLPCRCGAYPYNSSNAYALEYDQGTCNESLMFVDPPQLVSSAPSSLNLPTFEIGFVLTPYNTSIDLYVLLVCGGSHVSQLSYTLRIDVVSFVVMTSTRFCAPSATHALPVTHTRELAHTVSHELLHTHTAEVPHTHTHDLPKTHTAELPRTHTVEIPRTHTLEPPHTHTVEPPHTHTLELPRTHTVELPRTHTVEPPLTHTHELPHTETHIMPKTHSSNITLTISKRRHHLSNTSAVTQTHSITRNHSGSATLNLTLSHPHTRTRNVTKSVSLSVSRSQTRSRSLSVSSSSTISVTRTPPPTPTRTITSSVTATDTESGSRSLTGSLSHSVSQTTTRSASYSLTQTHSKSRTGTLSITRSQTNQYSASRTYSRSLSMVITRSASTSASLSNTGSVSTMVSLSASHSVSTSDSYSVTLNATITETLVPPVEANLTNLDNATVSLGSSIPLPLLQRITIAVTSAQASSVVEALVGLCTQNGSYVPLPNGDAGNEYPTQVTNQIHIVTILSLDGMLQAENGTLQLMIALMMKQSTQSYLPYRMVLGQVALNTSTGQLLGPLIQRTMGHFQNFENVTETYAGYALYRLDAVFSNLNMSLVLLIRPFAFIFLDPSYDPDAPKAPILQTQVFYFDSQPSNTVTVTFTTLSRFVEVEDLGEQIVFFTRGGQDVCAVIISTPTDAFSTAIKYTLQYIPFNVSHSPSSAAQVAAGGNCIRIGNAASGDYINAMVSDYDEGASEDGWRAAAAHKSIVVSNTSASSLPSFVFRTSLLCTIQALQLVFDAATQSFVVFVGVPVSFQECSETPPVVLSNRIFGTPLSAVDFPMALVVWGPTLSLVNTSSGEIFSGANAPGNSSSATLLLPFWMPPADAPPPSPLPGGDSQRLPFLMARDTMLEVLDLHVYYRRSNASVTLSIEKVVTDDLHREITAIALVPPFTLGMDGSSFEAIALISVVPNAVITALLRPKGLAFGNETTSAIVYRQVLELPTVEEDYVLSVQRWARRATRNDAYSSNCSFWTHLTPSAMGEDVLVEGELFQINSKKMSFVVCIDSTYGIFSALSSMASAPSGVNGGIMRFTTSSFIVTAHTHQISIVSVGPSFYAAADGSGPGVSWVSKLKSLVYGHSSQLAPKKAKAGGFFVPTPSAGTALFTTTDVFVFVENNEKDSVSYVVGLDIDNHGVVVFNVSLGVVCNETSSFMPIGADGTVIALVCLQKYQRVASEGSSNASSSSWRLEANLTVAILRLRNANDTTARQPRVTTGHAMVELSNTVEQLNTSALLTFSITTCTSSTGGSPTPPQDPIADCRIVVGIVGSGLWVISPPLFLGTNRTAVFAPLKGLMQNVNTSVGVQLAHDGTHGFLLSQDALVGIRFFDNVSYFTFATPEGALCTLTQRPGLFPTSNPCHMEVMDELCQYGGACALVLFINNGTDADVLGFNVSDGTQLYSMRELWGSEENETINFFSQLITPPQRWNNKIYVFSGFNWTVNCYLTRETSQPPEWLWSQRIQRDDDNGGESPSSRFINYAWSKASQEKRNMIRGVMRVSDFGIVVAVLQCTVAFTMPGEDETLATYSLMLGLDAFQGQQMWTVEPTTYYVGPAPDDDDGLVIDQSRTFLADADRAYAMWNSSVLIAQIASAPYLPSSSSSSGGGGGVFASQPQEERFIIGISIIDGTVLFQIPIAKPSNHSAVDEYGLGGGGTGVPGAVPSPSPLLIGLTPSSTVLLLTEFESRTVWAMDITLFPLGSVISTNLDVLASLQGASEAFSLFGTLDALPQSWRPSIALSSWDCISSYDYSHVLPGSISVLVNMSSCMYTPSTQLAGVLNWTALPQPSNPYWQRRSEHSYQYSSIPWLGAVTGIVAPGCGLSGRFDFSLLLDSNLEHFVVPHNNFVGVLSSFYGIPNTTRVLDISNATLLYAGSDWAGFGTSSALLSSPSSLTFLRAASSLESLDVSGNVLHTEVYPRLVSYLPPNLEYLNLSGCSLTGALFDLSEPSNITSTHMMRMDLDGDSIASPFNASLETLDLSRNELYLDGSSTLGNVTCNSDITLIPNIQWLSLAYNNLSLLTDGIRLFEIDTVNQTAGQVGTLCQLRYLNLAHTNMSGHVHFNMLAPSVHELDFSSNALRDTIDLANGPPWRTYLQQINVMNNPLLTGIIATECPPSPPLIVLDDELLCDAQNQGVPTARLNNGVLCANVNNNSAIYPVLLDSDSSSNGVLSQNALTMLYFHNVSSSTTGDTVTNCTFNTSLLLRFGGKIGRLDRFVAATALCLPRGMMIVDGFIEFSDDAPQSIKSVSLQYFPMANRTALSTYVLDLPSSAINAPVALQWCNYSSSECTILTGSYCLIDNSDTPYNLTATVSGGVQLIQYGGYSATVESTHVCVYNATPVIVFPLVDGSNIYPRQRLLDRLFACLPSSQENGAITGVSYVDGSIEFTDTTPVPHQFSTQLCGHLPIPDACSTLPSFVAPITQAQIDQERSCVDGFCAPAKTIIWSPCGTSMWNYEGFHSVGTCHPLSDVLRLPMQAIKNPLVTPCVYDNTPATCAQVAGRWTAFAIDLLLQDFQPDFINDTFLTIYGDNCGPSNRLCANGTLDTVIDNISDISVLCGLLMTMSMPPSQIMVSGYCENGGQSVVLTSCDLKIPIFRINASDCKGGLTAQCSACLPYIEPRATSLPYTFMVISSLKDIVFILLGAYFLSKPWFRRPITLCLTRMLLAITPLNPREKLRYQDVIMARFNPVVTAPGVLYDICDELLIKDEARRQEYIKRKRGGAEVEEDYVSPTVIGGAATTTMKEKRNSVVDSLASYRSWREELTLDNFLRTIGIRKAGPRDMSLEAENTSNRTDPNSRGPAINSSGNPVVVNSTSRISSRRSNLSEPKLREVEGSTLDRDHPMEQHSSTLFSEEGILVDDSVDSEVLQHFYRYYREAVCEHSRRQISNVDEPLVRQRFQHLFQVYSEMFQRSQVGRERLMSDVFLDINEDELDVQESQNFYSSFVVTSRNRFQSHATFSSATRTSARFSLDPGDRIRNGSGKQKSTSNSLPPSSNVRRSALHELTEELLGPAVDPSTSGLHPLNSSGEEMKTIQTVASPEEIAVLEALEGELQTARDELFEVAQMVPIILVPTMVDARFTPQAWMLFLEGAYCIVYLLVCIWQSATIPGYTAWQIYSSIYFRYVNSCASVGLVVNGLLRRVYLDEPLVASDPYLITALLLIGPSIATHIIPGICLYIWLHASVLIVWLPCCWIMRQLEKRFFYTLDPVSILFRVCFRLGTTVVATLLLQSSFNWALLYYEKRDMLGYLGIIGYEYSSRTWDCLVESKLMSLANMVQFMSAFV